RGDGAGDDRGRQLRGWGQQPRALRCRPFAAVVEFADDTRSHVPAVDIAPVVELLLQLILDDLALLLDHQNLFQSFGEMAHAARLQRPGHADLVQAQTDVRSVLLVYAQIVQCLQYIEVGFAAGDDAQAWPRRVEHQVIEAIGPRIGERRI